MVKPHVIRWEDWMCISVCVSERDGGGGGGGDGQSYSLTFVDQAVAEFNTNGLSQSLEW